MILLSLTVSVGLKFGSIFLGDNFSCLLLFCMHMKEELMVLLHTFYLFFHLYFFGDVCIAMNFGRQMQCVFTVFNRTHWSGSGSWTQMFAVKLFYASEGAGDLYLHYYSRLSPWGSQHMVAGAFSASQYQGSHTACRRRKNEDSREHGRRCFIYDCVYKFMQYHFRSILLVTSKSCCCC